MSPAARAPEAAAGGETVAGGTAILSPHPDDAALSLGGSLDRRFFAPPVTLVTLFGRCQYSRQYGFAGDCRDVTARRREEDAAYAAALELDLRYFELPEAPLREQEVFVDLQEELAVPAGLERAIAGVLDEVRPRNLVLPLGLGCHADHLVVHRLGAGLARRRRLCVFYYEDLPYAASVSRWALRRHLAVAGPDLAPITVPIVLARKLEALGIYDSQVGTREILAVRCHRRWLFRRPSERIWSAPEPAVRPTVRPASPEAPWT